MSSKPSKKKKSSREEAVPSRWSEWVWKEESSCYSRYRLDKYGKYEFEYDRSEQSPTNASNISSSYEESRSSETPRYTAPLQDTAYEESSTFSTSPATPGYTTNTFDDTTTALGALDLGKGKEPATDYADPRIAASYSVEPSVTQILQSQPAVDNSGYGGDQYSQNTGITSYPQSTYPYGGGYPANSGSSSYQQQTYPTQTWQNNVPYNPNPHNFIGEGSRGLEGPPDRPLDRRKLPRFYTANTLSYLDFTVRHGSEFKVGSVFKILWAEPTGDNGTQLSESESVQSRSHKYHEEFVHKIRRFAVVKTFSAHCLCLPIQTYQQQGARKKGAQAQHHAVIYSDKEAPIEYKGENLTKKAIRVEMSTPREKLDPHSRINYAKVYTIEYNVKVYFIGRVCARHRPQILADYQITQSLPPQDPGYAYDDSPEVYEDYTGGEGSSR